MDKMDKILSLLETLSKEIKKPNTPLEQKLSQDTLLEMSIKTMREKGYLTNDIIELRGGIGEYDRHMLVINGADAIKLHRREYIIMYILLQNHNSGAFNSVKDIISNVDDMTPKDYWPYIVPEDIYRQIQQIRTKLKKAGVNPNLLEGGSTQRGYRISTLDRNIIRGAGA